MPMLASLAREASRAGVTVAWQQWHAVGALASGSSRATSIVDPEALVLVSVALRDEERRLWDFTSDWARLGAGLLSVQRMKNLAAAYPETVRVRLQEFARRAVTEGRDARWRGLAGSDAGPRARVGKGHGKRPVLIEPPTLVLRLRAGIGVGVKADVLAFLLGMHGAWATARTVALATDYTTAAVRRAADDMATARLIHATAGTPTEYFVDAPAWARLLEMEGPLPRWRHWQAVFSFLVHLLEWLRAELPGRPTPYLLSSRARDLVERHRPAFERSQIPVPDPEEHPGSAYLAPFESSVRALLEWMLRAV